MRPAVGGVSTGPGREPGGVNPDARRSAWLCGASEATLPCAGASAPAGYYIPVCRAAAPRAWKTGTGEFLVGRVTQTPAVKCGIVATVTSHPLGHCSNGQVTSSPNPVVIMATSLPWKPDTEISLHWTSPDEAQLSPIRAGHIPCGQEGPRSDFDLSSKQFIL